MSTEICSLCLFGYYEVYEGYLLGEYLSLGGVMRQNYYEYRKI